MMIFVPFIPTPNHACNHVIMDFLCHGHHEQLSFFAGQDQVWRILYPETEMYNKKM